MTRVSAERLHWDGVYADKDPQRVSWFEPEPEHSLAMIEAARVGPEAAIVDIGGGASRLAGELLRRGHSDVTVADISERALAHARGELGDRAGEVTWIECDVRGADLGREFDLWHDRAVFHFMVEPDDRRRYLKTMRRSLEPGGQAIVATFGPEGPTSCSGLPVHRYGATQLAAELGPEFSLLGSELADHPTPSGNVQQFLYARFRREATADGLLESPVH